MELLQEKWSLYGSYTKLDRAQLITVLSGAAGLAGRIHHADLQKDLKSNGTTTVMSVTGDPVLFFSSLGGFKLNLSSIPDASVCGNNYAAPLSSFLSAPHWAALIIFFVYLFHSVQETSQPA